MVSTKGGGAQQMHVGMCNALRWTGMNRPRWGARASGSSAWGYGRRVRREWGRFCSEPLYPVSAVWRAFHHACCQVTRLVIRVAILFFGALVCGKV